MNTIGCLSHTPCFLLGRIDCIIERCNDLDVLRYACELKKVPVEPVDLVHAIHCRKYQFVKYLVSNYIHPNEGYYEETPEIFSPLWAVVTSAPLYVVKLFEQYGADWDLKCHTGETFRQIALEKAHFSAVRRYFQPEIRCVPFISLENPYFDDCPICLKEKPTWVYWWVNCKHFVCMDCYPHLVKWTCPICRSPH